MYILRTSLVTLAAGFSVLTVKKWINTITGTAVLYFFVSLIQLVMSSSLSIGRTPSQIRMISSGSFEKFGSSHYAVVNRIKTVSTARNNSLYLWNIECLNKLIKVADPVSLTGNNNRINLRMTGKCSIVWIIIGFPPTSRNCLGISEYSFLHRYRLQIT